MVTKKNGSAKKNGRKKVTPAKQAASGRTKKGTFAPGQSGNPAGRPKGRDFNHALIRYLEDANWDIDEAAGLLTRNLHDAAMDGDVQAAKLFLDRCYGPLRQEHDITSTSTVNIPDKMRGAMKDIAKRNGVQATALDELEARSDG